MLPSSAGAEIYEENHPYSEEEHDKDLDHLLNQQGGSKEQLHLIPPKQAPEAQGH